MKQYRFTYRATGNFSFPVDMLRYDVSWPRGEHDSHVIASSLRFDERVPQGGFSVELRHNDTNRDWRPTEGRWESFGWHTAELVRDPVS